MKKQIIETVCLVCNKFFSKMLKYDKKIDHDIAKCPYCHTTYIKYYGRFSVNADTCLKENN